MRVLLIVLCGLLAFAGSAGAGPVLDDILNYMFLDQTVPMRDLDQYFIPNGTHRLTKDSPIGQTFVTGPETETIIRIRAFCSPDKEWQRGEGAEMVVWDSPEKKVALGRYTIWYEFRGFLFCQADWEVRARVQPNTSYYFEISYVGDGDGKLSNIGYMKGRDAYKSGQGYLAGKEADFDLCFQTHCKRPLDRVANLKKAFARFDLERPELAGIKEAVEAEDFDTAITRTITYFETRKEPTAIIDPEHVPVYDPTFDTRQGDMAIKHYFGLPEAGGAGYAGPDFGWRAAVGFDENGQLTAREFDLNWWGPRGPLCKAYLATGNEKYAKKLNDILVDWYLDNPPPLESRIGGQPNEQVWTTLSTGVRLAHCFLAYSFLHSSPSFTQDLRMAWILGLADHCDTLVVNGEHAGGNWSFTQNSSMLKFAVNFPEYKNAKVWQETAAKRIGASIKNDWLDDGVESEMAPGYQRFCSNYLTPILDLMRERGLETPFSAELGKLLESQAEYFMYLVAPDGLTPFLGDWGDSQERPVLVADAERFDRPDMLYVGTAGKEGKKPKELSKLYPCAGIVTFRSDWGDVGRPYEDTRYMMFHGLHYGSHGHADLNSLTLYAYGRELLTDPGSYIYGSPEHELMCQSVSHNLMTVNRENCMWKPPAEFKAWLTTPMVDYLSSWLGGYKSAKHTREVMFVRANGDKDADDYWIVRDTAEGTGTHLLEQRWHFAPSEVSIDKATLTARTNFEDKGNLAIMQVDPSRLELNEETARTWRPRGITDDAKILPTMIYKANAPLPAAFDTVLYPFEGRAMPPVKLQSLEKSADGLNSAFKVTRGGVEDLFVFQKSAGKKSLSADKVVFDGERLFVRRVGGKVRSVLLVNGTSLTVDGKQIVKAGKPVSWVAVSFDGKAAKASTGSAGTGVTVVGLDGKQVTPEVTDTDKLVRRPVNQGK